MTISPRELRLRKQASHLVGRIVTYIVLIAVGFAASIPFIWMVSTSFKDEPQIWRYPPQWIPDPWIWTNFKEALADAPFGRYFLNSFIVAAGIIAERVIFASLAAYAFARLKFPGRELLFTLVLATVMVPNQVTLIPLYLIVHRLHWIDTYQGLILPSLANAFSIFWLRQFFMTLPSELEDAARIDGCGRLGIIFRIFLPLSIPALSVLCLLSFRDGWNMFLWPLIMTNKEAMRPIELGIYLFRMAHGQGRQSYHTAWVMAANTVAIVPIVLFFVLTQHQMVRGVTLSGLKG